MRRADAREARANDSDAARRARALLVEFRVRNDAASSVHWTSGPHLHATWRAVALMLVAELRGAS